jgi:hypothetical protein
MTDQNSKTLFFTTSPRTPLRIIPEIRLLNTYFADEKWNAETQKSFMSLLREKKFFNGEGKKDPEFSARDRITRAPKMLGFVTLYPKVCLTAAGQNLLQDKQKEKIFLRQLLKFQLPSPYHRFNNKTITFCVKPYLEIFRLIHHFGSLTFDELMIFGLQLIDYKLFDIIVIKIEQFRKETRQTKQRYELFKKQYLEKELKMIYNDEITLGNTKIRESNDTSLEKFLQTKTNNMYSYADALCRYLKVTGLVKIFRAKKSRSISIKSTKIQEVEYFLKNIDKEPINDEKQYIDYLIDPTLPKLDDTFSINS